MVLGWSVIGLMLSSLYVIFDLVIIMDGGISMDDYILGALTLYLDVINMFLHILALFAEKK